MVLRCLLVTKPVMREVCHSVFELRRFQLLRGVILEWGALSRSWYLCVPSQREKRPTVVQDAGEWSGRERAWCCRSPRQVLAKAHTIPDFWKAVSDPSMPDSCLPQRLVNLTCIHVGQTEKTCICRPWANVNRKICICQAFALGGSNMMFMLSGVGRDPSLLGLGDCVVLCGARPGNVWRLGRDGAKGGFVLRTSQGCGSK